MNLRVMRTDADRKPCFSNQTVFCFAAAQKGVKAIIFKSPCIALVKPDQPLSVDQSKCIGCKRCIREIGCPGIVINDGKVCIDPGLCTGCGLCAQLCPVHAIGGGCHD